MHPCIPERYYGNYGSNYTHGPVLRPRLTGAANTHVGRVLPFTKIEEDFDCEY